MHRPSSLLALVALVALSACPEVEPPPEEEEDCTDPVLCALPADCRETAAELPSEVYQVVGDAFGPVNLLALPPAVTLLVNTDELVELVHPDGDYPGAGTLELDMAIGGCERRPRVRVGDTVAFADGRVRARGVDFVDSFLGILWGASLDFDDVVFDSRDPLGVQAYLGEVTIRNSRFERGGLVATWGGRLLVEDTEFIDAGTFALAAWGDTTSPTSPLPEDECSLEVRNVTIDGLVPDSNGRSAVGLMIQGRSDVLVDGLTVREVEGYAVRVEMNQEDHPPGDPDHSANNRDAYRVRLSGLRLSDIDEDLVHNRAGYGVYVDFDGEALLEDLRIERASRGGLVVGEGYSRVLVNDAVIADMLPGDQGELGRCAAVGRGAWLSLNAFELNGCVESGVSVADFAVLELEEGTIEGVLAGRNENSGAGILAAPAGWVRATDVTILDPETFGVFVDVNGGADLHGVSISGASLAGTATRGGHVELTDSSISMSEQGYGVAGWVSTGGAEGNLLVEEVSIEGATGAGVWFAGSGGDGELVVRGATIDGTTRTNVGALEVGGHAVQLIVSDLEVAPVVEQSVFGAGNLGAGVFVDGSGVQLAGNSYATGVSVWQQSCAGSPLDLGAEPPDASAQASLCEQEEHLDDPTLSMNLVLPDPEEGDLYEDEPVPLGR